MEASCHHDGSAARCTRKSWGTNHRPELNTRLDHVTNQFEFGTVLSFNAGYGPQTRYGATASEGRHLSKPFQTDYEAYYLSFLTGGSTFIRTGPIAADRAHSPFAQSLPEAQKNGAATHVCLDLRTKPSFHLHEAMRRAYSSTSHLLLIVAMAKTYPAT